MTTKIYVNIISNAYGLEREIFSWMMNQFSDEIALTDQRQD